MYRSEIRTRPDGTSYVQCIWIGEEAKSLTEDQLTSLEPPVEDALVDLVSDIYLNFELYLHLMFFYLMALSKIFRFHKVYNRNL